jgi:DNA polymerase-4
VDEAFLDVTGSLELLGNAETIARSIKKEIQSQLCLSCSIGVAPNKLLAKLGSRIRKPNGLVIIHSEDIPILLRNLPVKELCGIGPGTETVLATLGIRTCGELGRTPVETLRIRFGIMGERLHQMGLGIDNSPVLSMEALPEAKGVGHSMTLPRDVEDRETLSRHLLQLSEKVGRRMRREGYRGRIVSVTLRYRDFSTFTKQHKGARYLDDGQGIFKMALEIFNTFSLKQSVRLVGVSVSDLVRDLHQLPLFDEEKKRRSVLTAMDRVNDRYGEFCITWGTLLNRYLHKEVISPAWKPKGVKRY